MFSDCLLRQCCVLESSCYYFDGSIELAGQFDCKAIFERLIFCELTVEDLIASVVNFRYGWTDKTVFLKFILLQLQFFHF
jgi:hypothetical protein